MTRLRVFLSRLFGVSSGRTRDAELRTEIDGHINEAADDYVRQGLSPADARRAALRRFGGVTQTIEAHRAQRRFTFFSTLGQDLRYAMRTLDPCARLRDRRHPDAGDWDSREYDDRQRRERPAVHPAAHQAPEQVAEVLSGGGAGRIGGFVKHTYKRYTSFRDMNTSFAALAAIRDVTAPIGDRAPTAGTATETGVVRGEVASGNYFDMLGIRAALGRAISPDDDRTPNGHPVVVISDRLWRTHFNADPQTLGPGRVLEWPSLHNHRHRAGVVHRDGLRERNGFLGAAHDAGPVRCGTQLVD